MDERLTQAAIHCPWCTGRSGRPFLLQWFLLTDLIWGSACPGNTATVGSQHSSCTMRITGTAVNSPTYL